MRGVSKYIAQLCDVDGVETKLLEEEVRVGVGGRICGLQGFMSCMNVGR